MLLVEVYHVDNPGSPTRRLLARGHVRMTKLSPGGDRATYAAAFHSVDEEWPAQAVVHDFPRSSEKLLTLLAAVLLNAAGWRAGGSRGRAVTARGRRGKHIEVVL